MSRRLVCVTGAGSGIGEATALLLAARGASLVLTGRDAASLDSVAERCRSMNARCTTVVADVADAEQVEAVARAADELGELDAWVNNAGVLAVGRFDEIPPDVFRRVLDTNFFGYVNGARAALARFRSRGRGVLVNNASLLGVVGGTYLSPYVSSKFAIRGFSEVLRQEYVGSGIDICTVLPSAILTPIWERAANYTGRRLRPLPPLYSTKSAARAIVGCIERPRAEVVVGRAGNLMRLGHALPRPVLDRIAVAYAQLGFGGEDQEATAGNVFEHAGPDDRQEVGLNAPRVPLSLLWLLAAQIARRANRSAR